MYNHAPNDYRCPICIALEGIENDQNLICQSDIVFKDDLVNAFISSFFIGNNPGHIIIAPNEHFENIYDLPNSYAHRIHEVAKEMALALKQAYQCGGITTLQNNEPVGGQHAFHYHFHVFPRYSSDNLHQHMLEKKSATAQERLPYANKIKKYLQNNQ